MGILKRSCGVCCGDRIAPVPSAGMTPRSLFALLSCVALTWPIGAAAQGVTGVVSDERSSAPLPGVLVAVMDQEGARIGAVLTDASGRFTVDVPVGGPFTARAERIGLQSVTSESFDVRSGAVHFLLLSMSDQAIEIEGVVVDSRVRQCRVDPFEALRIQRWWDELRKALEVSSVVQRDQLVRFRIQRYEREWSLNLRSVAAERTELQIGFSARPFASPPADFLAEGGFVQGPLREETYYAPDADVLLSDVFLSQHCFATVTHDDQDDWIGIHFEPTRTRKIPDVIGTLWVDTMTAELQMLEYKYANLDWLPPNESGGEVRFQYLPSGAWVVSDWYIRMPQLGVRYGDGPGDRAEVVGYFDMGGRVRQLATPAGSRADATGSARIRGSVYDSIRGAPLAGARVTVLGTRFATDTDVEGRFDLTGLPAGKHQVTFFHSDLTRWGVSSPFVEVEVRDGGAKDVVLAVPRFRSAATAMCPGNEDVQAVLTGHVVDEDGIGVESATVLVEWELSGGVDRARTFNAEVRTGSRGRYLVCRLPGEAPTKLTVVTESGRGRTVRLVLPGGAITYRELRAGR
jgi:carboxypeptidase family protein